MVCEEDNILSYYYDSLSRVKILTKAEEKEYFKRYSSGDTSAGRMLIKSCLRLCFSIAKSYWKDSNPETLKDLISVGNEGLIKALSKFDISKNAKFSTYSAYWVLMYIRKYVVEDSNIVKPPISIRRKSRIRDVLSQKEPSRIIYKEASEYNTICSYPTPEEEVVETDWNHYRFLLGSGLIRFLKDREQKIITLSFGLNGESPQSLSSIGRTFSLSSERVRQLKEAGLLKLRSWASYFSEEDGVPSSSTSSKYS